MARHLRLTSITAVLLAGAVAASGETLPAASLVWAPLGPGGGEVTAVSWCPSAPDRVYAGTAEAGIFRSDDRGAHWLSASAGLPFLFVTTLYPVSGNCSVVYAATINPHQGYGCTPFDPFPEACVATRMAVSTDAGASWRDASQGLTASATLALVPDPRDPATLYAVNMQGLARTRVGSTSWTPVWQPDVPSWVVMTSAAVDPADSEVLYVTLIDTVALPGDANVGGVYKSTDRGASWVLAHQFPGSTGSFNLLFADGSLYAISEWGGFDLWQSSDGARTWTRIAHPQPTSWAFGLSASRQGNLYLRVTGLDLVSSDQGHHWQKLSLAGTVEGYSPAPDGSVLLAWGEGAWRSTDGGFNWRTSDAGLPGRSIWQLNLAADGTLYALGEGGLYRISPKHRRWEQTNFGSLLALDPSEPETLYAAFAYPYLLPRSPFGLSIDDGRTWAGFFYPTPEDETLLVIDPTRSERLYSVSSPATGNDPNTCFLFRSEDRGLTWTGLCDSPGFGVLLIDPQNPRVLYGMNGGFVERSADGGATWAAAEGGIEHANVQALALDPEHSGVLYAATDQGLFGTVNGGTSWTLLSPALGRWTNQLIVNPDDPTELYAGVLEAPPFAAETPFEGRGVFVSRDAGKTWALLGRGLPEVRLAAPSSSTRTRP